MKCSQCDNKARPGQRYCRSCHNLESKRYRSHKKQIQFRKGAEACRRAAVELFEKVGIAEMTGFTASELMRSLEVPRET